jgi:secreted Zn-dependent insulinase-like peptidase
VKNRGVQEYVFDETKRVGEIQFDFLDKTSPVGYTIKLAGKMQDFDTPEKIQDIIKHMYVVETLDKERTQEMSNLLVDPSNLNIYLRSKTFAKTPELVPLED